MNEFNKSNCWEVKQCGREPGGSNVGSLGICPAAISSKYQGINGGQCAGRVCWAVAGTLCNGQIQGFFAQKLVNCSACDFFQQVKAEENVGDAHLLLQAFQLKA